MESDLTNLQKRRRVLFSPCATKEDLWRWVKVFLGIDLPNTSVDPESNSSPMDLLWELYQVQMKGGDPEFREILYYAARDAFKTLVLSIIELLAVYHLRRDAVHCAAIEQQARKAASYLKKYLSKPVLRDFVLGNNKREVSIVRYEGGGRILTPLEWGTLTPANQDQYEKSESYFKILVATKASLNSDHCLMMVIDELDLIYDRVAFEEGKAIPSATDTQDPLTIMTSSRKTAFGLVQAELDNAQSSGLNIRHWNIIDVARRCTEDRYLPHEPQVTVYRSDDLLRVTTKEGLDVIPERDRATYREHTTYAGCAKCRLYPLCRSLLVGQTGTSPLLKKISDVVGKVRGRSLGYVQSQYMCRKPMTEGLVWPRFERGAHVISTGYMAELVTGVETRDISKTDLVAILNSVGVLWYAGMDFGYGHNFSVVTMAKFGELLLVVDVINVPGLDPGQQINICENRIRSYNPQIFADTSSPGVISMFRKAGWTMRTWSKGKIKDGIDAVSFRLWPTIGEPQLYLLEGDDGCEQLAKDMSQYHYILDAAGKPTDEPQEEGDDLCDAVRYAVVNLSRRSGDVFVCGDTSPGGPVVPGAPVHPTQPVPFPAAVDVKRQQWNQVMENIGMSTDGHGEEEEDGVVVVGKSTPSGGGSRLSWVF